MSILSAEVGKTCRVFTQITDLSSVVSCPSPTGTTVIFQAETNDVRWRPDGTAPTASVGFLLTAGSSACFVGDLSKVKFIQVGAGSTLNVSVFE